MRFESITAAPVFCESEKSTCSHPKYRVLRPHICKYLFTSHHTTCIWSYGDVLGAEVVHGRTNTQNSTIREMAPQHTLLLLDVVCRHSTAVPTQLAHPPLTRALEGRLHHPEPVAALEGELKLGLGAIVVQRNSVEQLERRQGVRYRY